MDAGDWSDGCAVHPVRTVPPTYAGESLRSVRTKKWKSTPPTGCTWVSLAALVLEPNLAAPKRSSFVVVYVPEGDFSQTPK